MKYIPDKQVGNGDVISAITIFRQSYITGYIFESNIR